MIRPPPTPPNRGQAQFDSRMDRASVRPREQFPLIPAVAAMAGAVMFAMSDPPTWATGLGLIVLAWPFVARWMR